MLLTNLVKAGWSTNSHIVPFGKFHILGSAPPEILHNVKYDAPKEVGGDIKCFDSPITKKRSGPKS